MNTFNKFMVGARGNGNIVVMNPQSIYSREDAINLCAWIKIIACISDEELDAFEEQASRPDSIPTPPAVPVAPVQKGRTPSPSALTTQKPSVTLQAAVQTPKTTQRMVTDPGFGTRTSVPVSAPEAPVVIPAEPHDIMAELEAEKGAAKVITDIVEAAVSTVEQVTTPPPPQPPAGQTPGFAKCKSGHEHPVTWTTHQRIRQPNPARCPTCSSNWIEVRPA